MLLRHLYGCQVHGRTVGSDCQHSAHLRLGQARTRSRVPNQQHLVHLTKRQQPNVRRGSFQAARSSECLESWALQPHTPTSRAGGALDIPYEASAAREHAHIQFNPRHAGSATEAVTAELKQLEKERDEAVQSGKRAQLHACLASCAIACSYSEVQALY